MLRAPYLRAAVTGHRGILLPLEYHSGSSHGAASVLEQLRRLDDGGRFATANAAPSLALWLYRSSLLRRLWLEGIVFDAIVEDRLTARGFTALLRRTLQTPRFLRGEETATQEEAIGLVWGVQKEFALRVVAAIVDENQWRWTLREAWDCATALVKDSVHPDDVVSLLLLLPLAQRLATMGDGGRTLHERLQELHARKLHGGVLWLLARRASPTPRPEQKLLEAATAAACAASTCVMLKSAGGNVVGDEDGEDRVTSVFQTGRASGSPRQGSIFLPFWRALFYEMVQHAHCVLRDPTAPERGQVGALLSLRRVLCSFRRHGRVHPVLELHIALTTPWRKGLATDPAAVNARYGPLVFREVLLLDAYTLMTLGHVGETAIDVNDAAVREVTTIQSRCLSHLEALARNEPETGVDRDVMGLHRGARAGVERRLREGIRLSFKLLLRCGAYKTIHEILTRCPALGGSWESGKALVMLGKHTEAVSVFTHFLESTRQHFASGIPQHIRSMMLEAVGGAARSCLSDAGDVPGPLLRLYELTRTWGFPVPAAVVFATILRACCTEGGAPAGHTAVGWKRRLVLMNTLLRHHLTNATYVRDGLLLSTVELYVKLLAECRDEALLSHLELLPALQLAHPELPVYRVALLHFLRVEHQDAVTAVLQHIVPSFRDATVCLTPLQELPLAALEALARHVAQAGCGEQRVVTAVGTALEYRQFAEEQRLPWQCHLCRHWNKKNASVCWLCGALELAVVRCGACGGFSPTSAPDCQLCGAKTQERAGEQGAPHVREGCTIFPLRKWRCGRCNHTNEPHHIFYCTKCGSVQPAMEEALTQTSFHCRVCSRHNPLGLLRPWCPTCGTLSPVAVTGPPKTLWRCVECHTLTPWLFTHCQCCGGAKPAQTSRFDTPWFTPVCSGCKVTNPAWSIVCHGCGARLTACGEREEQGEGKQEELEVDLAVGQVSAAASSASCRHCGTKYADAGETVCQTCFIPRPNNTFRLWVCLRNNCLGVNLHRATDNGLLVCNHCGVAHDLAVVGGYYSNPLRFRETASVGKGDGGREDLPTAPSSPGSRNSQSPSALLLPVPSAPRVCSACDAYLQLQNVAQICPLCFHCGYASPQSSGVSAAEHDVALRLILQAMLQMVHRVKQGLVSHPKALSLLCSTTLAYLRADEAQLPWRSCDLANDMRCSVHSRVPVMEDDTIHSSVRDVAELIRTICAIASSTMTTTGTNGSTKEVATFSWVERRPWVLLALDWVDLMNRTTEYDELGFDVLAQLCMVVRPQQGTHIFRETRWAYLRHMKLPREWFVNDVVCPTCLLPKTRETWEAAHTCRCTVRVTDVGRTHAPVLTTTT
ncbi:hypothetical protein TRSC58_06423 [Trypanosoma rangeli SC58]|uniref:RanBP2-type domain-containing protein n=1 Tax=Trypanosoma rangeli SC58 TaxID=429131 RepID=A0A061IXZ5_TRYRA|nr:hypothetical protein TRSC58_06423 [Trypanosoma rangeli SC58]